MVKRALLKIAIIIFLSHCHQAKPKLPFSEPKNISKIENIDVALVLGGGGSKGFAHLGAIEVLEEYNIPIDLIVGTSAGSAVGAFYADNKDIKKTKNILFKAKSDQLLDFSLMSTLQMLTSVSSFVTGQAYEDFIAKNLTAKNFHELKIPLVVVTVDEETGMKYTIKDGPIAPAVRASSAIPPIFSPVKIYGRTLIDGGIVEPVPVETAKHYKPKLIIAIDINNLPETQKSNNMLELTYRALWFSYYKLSRIQSSQADIDIHPNLNGHGTFEDDKKDELYLLGKKAAIQALPQIIYNLKKLNIR